MRGIIRASNSKRGCSVMDKLEMTGEELKTLIDAAQKILAGEKATLFTPVTLAPVIVQIFTPTSSLWRDPSVSPLVLPLGLPFPRRGITAASMAITAGPNSTPTASGGRSISARPTNIPAWQPITSAIIRQTASN